jgi:hypothetical protein
MRSVISFLTLLSLKGLANIFYSYEARWPEDKKIDWKDVRLIILLNHTSLFEVLYIGILPTSALRQLSLRMVLPGADKTMNRPFVGFLFKLFSPNVTAVTRKRDDSWHQFLGSIRPDSIAMIAAEGRMKRPNGLDLEGKKMTVKGGVVDVLEIFQGGTMGIAYSGGLHHIQVPGQGWPKLFRRIKMDVEVFDIAEYKAQFSEPIGSKEWRKQVLADLQHRLETKPPIIER